VQASKRDGDASSATEQRPLVLVAVVDARLGSYLDRELSAADYRIVWAPDPIEALQAWPSPEVVLLGGSARLVEQVRERVDAPIVVLTPDDSVEGRVAFLEAGADDVVTVPFNLSELLARLRALRRGRRLASARGSHGALNYADVHLDLDTREVTRGDRRVELRHKGFELLAYFMRHPHRVLSRRELLEDVWGYDFLGDSNVIEVTVSHIRQALEAGGEPRLISTVRPIGYILNARGEAAYSCKA
jgi:two-component system, OmpR family, response regulator MprA